MGFTGSGAICDAERNTWVIRCNSYAGEVCRCDRNCSEKGSELRDEVIARDSKDGATGPGIDTGDMNGGECHKCTEMSCIIGSIVDADHK